MPTSEDIISLKSIVNKIVQKKMSEKYKTLPYVTFKPYKCVWDTIVDPKPRLKSK